jgi:hypothetical protein
MYAVAMARITLHHHTFDSLQHIAGQCIQRAKVSRALLVSHVPGPSQTEAHDSPGRRNVKTSQQQ